jgi:hypothetical protein
MHCRIVAAQLLALDYRRRRAVLTGQRHRLLREHRGIHIGRRGVDLVSRHRERGGRVLYVVHVRLGWGDKQRCRSPAARGFAIAVEAVGTARPAERGGSCGVHGQRRRDAPRAGGQTLGSTGQMPELEIGGRAQGP